MKLPIQFNRRFVVIALAGTAVALPSYLLAGNLTVPHQLQNGNVADADEVNQNFAAVELAVNDNNDRLDTLEATLKLLNDRVGVGGVPDPSAKLDVVSTTGGILPPRMTTSDRDAISGGSPANGLVIYNTDTSKLELFNGATWEALQSSPTPSSPWLVDTDGNLSGGLVAYWKLDEPGGVRFDSAGSNDLSEINSVTTAPGQQGGAAQFVQANQEYLQAADNPVLSMGDLDFTVAGWIRLDSKVSSTIVSKYTDPGSTANSEYLLFYYPINDTFYWSVNNGGSAGVAQTTVPGGVNTGEWYFVVGWHDATNDKVHVQVNNSPPSTKNWAGGCLDGANLFRIGRFSADLADARVDEVGIWKRVLTGQERADLYNNGLGNTYSP